jgi:hypothetical protein
MQCNNNTSQHYLVRSSAVFTPLPVDYYHVSETNQRNWNVSLTTLFNDDDMVARSCASAAGHIALRAALGGDQVGPDVDPFKALFIDLAPRQWIGLQLHHKCSVGVHVISEGKRKLDNFVPAQVEVDLSTGITLIWPGTSEALAIKTKALAGHDGHDNGHATPTHGVGRPKVFVPVAADFDPTQGGHCGGDNDPVEGSGDGGGSIECPDHWAANLYERLARGIPLEDLSIN